MTDRLGELSAAGVAIWLDDLSRERLTSGNLDQLRREKHLVGVTSNPTIFAKALSDADVYNRQLRDLAVCGVDVDEAVRLLTTYDVRWACDVMRPAYDATGGVDGRVSIEVDPRLAHETEKTDAEAELLWWLVDRPNLFIKIPATEAGLPAITATLAKGISVNVTLIFSLERYAAVIDAFLAGMEQAKANGHDLSTIASVASFFVSRVDTEADRRLAEAGREDLQGRLGVANAKLAYRHFREAFSGERWEYLAGKGARKQRPLWASTSTKNPDYRDVLYVEELIGPETVNTMPRETIEAFQDHGEIRGDTIVEGVDDAERLLEELREAGVDYDHVVETLEAEGVKKFADSFDELLAGIASKRGELAAA